MNVHRRQILRLAGGAAALPLLARTSSAQAYPTRPVKILVGYSAGGGVDITARLMGQWLSEKLGQQFVIENRTGAATNIATEVMIRSPNDGYTLLLTNAANAINATYYEKLPFDFLADTAPVASIMSVPFVLVVTPSAPFKTVPELIAYAKANPGKINCGSGGAGGPDHGSLELFKMMTGTNIVHVPYRGLAPAVQDVIGGQIQSVFSTIPAAIGHIKSGKLRALAVTTKARSATLPDVPPLGDFVKGFDSQQWYGMSAPKGTPPDVIAAINKEIRAALADAKIKQRIGELGGDPMSMTPAEWGKFLASETEKWGKVIKAAGAKAK
ncbi:MAG: tripartite tricarboxylate transporter substrate binding protein [Alphaproteobacteria bacterium]|nr:tripartite tricarboxylate transporter substrate binding protein [Alphaproteobacteria bacterium]